MEALASHLVHEVLYQKLARAGSLPTGRLAEVFHATPRRPFLPAGADATRDAAVVLDGSPGAARTTSTEPSVVLRLLSHLPTLTHGRVLEIGTGSGYQAALLSQLAAEVVTLEIEEDLARQAAGRLRDVGAGNVTVVTGDGSAGFAAEAPYDAIVVAATAGAVAPRWVEQLREGGTLLVPLATGVDPPHPVAVLTRSGHHLIGRFVAPVHVDGLIGPLAPRPVHQDQTPRWVVRSHVDLPAALLATTPEVTRTVGTWRFTELSGLKLCTELCWGDGVVVSGVPDALPYAIRLPGARGELGWSPGIASRSSVALWTGFSKPVVPVSGDELVPVVIRAYGREAERLAEVLESAASTWRRVGCPAIGAMAWAWSAQDGWEERPCAPLSRGSGPATDPVTGGGRRT